MPHAAVIGGQLVGHFVRELVHVGARLQASMGDLFYFIGGRIGEARLGHNKIANTARFDEVDDSIEAERVERLVNGHRALAKFDFNERIANDVVVDEAQIVVNGVHIPVAHKVGVHVLLDESCYIVDAIPLDGDTFLDNFHTLVHNLFASLMPIDDGRVDIFACVQKHVLVCDLKNEKRRFRNSSTGWAMWTYHRFDTGRLAARTIVAIVVAAHLGWTIFGQVLYGSHVIVDLSS